MKRKAKTVFTSVLSFLLAVVMVAGIAPLSSFVGLELPGWMTAEAATSGIYTYEIADGEATITGCSSASGAITIPSTLGGYPVTSIGEQAFVYCSSLTSVTIPDSVTNIGIAAFGACSSLTEIITDEKNEYYASIDGVLFNKTKTELIQYPAGNARTSYIIPNSVTSLGWCAFAYCDNLTSVTISDSVTNIGFAAFGVCSSLTSVTIPNSVTSIGDLAFMDCDKLTDVYYSGTAEEWKAITIGSNNDPLLNATIYDNSGTVIKTKDFYVDGEFTYIVRDDTAIIIGCDSSVSGDVVIPSTLGGYPVTSIGDFAFDRCTALTSVTIPNSVTNIGSAAFQSCSSLTSVTIPDSVTNIGEYAFNICSSLTSVTIPDSVTSVGYSAFASCDGLTSIIVDDKNENYASIDGVLFNKDKTELMQYPIGNARTSYTIPDSVTSVGYSAFASCDSLISVTIPDSVTSIGDSAFGCCRSLTNITVDENNKNYSSADGVLFNKDKTELIQYPIGNSRTSYTIPSSVTSIGKDAFKDCDNLKSVTIPDSVTSIGEDAFMDCDSLTSVTIPDSVTIIGNYAFESCDALTSVTIGNGVTSISYAVFSCCTALTSVTIPNSVTSIDDQVFEGCYNLKDVYYSGTEEELQAITIGSYNDSLLNATIHDNYGNLLKYFTYTVTDSKVTITGCSNIDGDIVIPSTLGGYPVTSIGDDAFSDCSSLTSVTLPDSVVSIGDTAFIRCSSLKNVTIPDSVTSIGNFAFYDCSSLTSVTIGNSVTNIGADAFYDCSKLTDVYYTGSEEDWNNITIDNDNAPLLNATIHYNWTGEAPNPQTVKDESSGIEISAPFGAYEGTLELEIEEVFDGESYNVVSTIDGAAQNKVYDITTKVDGEPAQPGKAVTVRIPLPEGYDPDRTYVYHVNSETGEVENMNARYEDGCLVFETDHFSVYAVVEMEEERSFFGKVIDVLLGIVSLPVKLIVGLFKLIIGLFI